MTQPHIIFDNFTDGLKFTGNLQNDVVNFLTQNGHIKTAEHCLTVAKETKKLARKYNSDEEAGFQAGLLHDISAVFPAEERVLAARNMGIDVLPEEEAFPLIIHQKLSAYMAKDIFNISNHMVINAIGCHTTLKANASLVDKILFIVDKIKWDQKGAPPYLKDILLALNISLDEAVFCYLDYMWQNKNQLRVVHPWLRETHIDLSIKLGKG